MKNKSKILLSVPSGMEKNFQACEPARVKECYVTSDPADRPLGSGGGTVNLLISAWKQQNPDISFEEWAAQEMRILVHGGGQSRRLPAYAPAGKLFIPVPVFRWALGERIDQCLLDLQIPLLRRIADAAPDNTKTMIVSGDALLRSEGALPKLKEADVILFGLWAQPEEAKNFGVMFCNRDNPEQLVTFLQKPAPERTRKLAKDYMFMLDIGVWLLSERAVNLLMNRCGWDEKRQKFENGEVGNYDMYGEWGLHLGEKPAVRDEQFSDLSVAVVPLPDGEFYHFGCSRDIIESTYQLQNLVKDQTKLGVMRGRMYASNFVQNSRFDAPLRESENHMLWVENSCIPASWSIEGEHVLTGVPGNSWSIKLSEGVCLDFVPVGEQKYAVRNYHIEDSFRGEIGVSKTRWMGDSAKLWFSRRGIEMNAVCSLKTDMQNAPVFAVCECSGQDMGEFVQWLIDREPAKTEENTRRWLECERMSAQQLTHNVNLTRLYAERKQNRLDAVSHMALNSADNVFYRLDLEATAQLFVDEELALPPLLPSDHYDRLTLLHSRMFRAAVLRGRMDADADSLEMGAFEVLRETIISSVGKDAVKPVCGVIEDQIVWGRSPIRLDFAGGWSDTPPYCLEFGGSVVNIAVDLNGQPPIQAFARLADEPVIVVRSIDLGLEERLRTYEDIAAYDKLGSGFAIARAALALTGFHPRFNNGCRTTLREQLNDFGGGIELSMLAAVPKGSGLGTSSILAITLLGTLSNMLNLDWDFYELVRRASALEQMLTSGGGWQDQIGGVLRGVKLIETDPGLEQRPLIRWLPEQFFDDPLFHDNMLLYYTGVTRVAHSILGEIVRGIFLNGSDHLAIIDEIRSNAKYSYDVILRQDFEGFIKAVRRSWELNMQLDSGTNVPDVQHIIDACGNDLAACKLLGAGGGGYLLIVTRDSEASERIRSKLEKNPPNKRARFVDFSISNTGLQVTRS